MSKKLINISIFVLLAIFCACGFVSFNNNSVTIAAAAENAVECYTLIERDAVNNTSSTYVANNSVGTMDGTGYYMVGQTANLNVVAGESYHIVGFKVVYLDQNNKSEYVWLGGDNETSHTLSYVNAPDNTMLVTKEQFAPIISSERASQVKVQIARVGENLQVTPIFDHFYSRIKIDNSQLVLAECESETDLNGTTLYYSHSWTSILDNVNVYEDAYIETENVRYYYGTVYSQEDVFYTLHKKQDATKTEEKIPLSVGAFRQDETPSLNLAVNDYYDVWDVQVLRDTQFVSEKQNEALQINKTAEQNTENISLENYSMELNTTLHSDLELSIKAHKLHKVALQFLVDGAALAEKHYADFFGEITVDRTNVRANVSSSNYFTAFENIEVNGENYPTQYFIKSAANNNQKAFNIQGVQEIVKVQDGLTYSYYNFIDLELDGIDQGSNSISFNEPTNNDIEVKVKYEAVKYNVNFEYREKQGDNLVDLTGEEIASIELSRGEEIALGVGEGSTNVVANISIPGYAYAGLSLVRAKSNEIQNDIVVVIDEQKPTDITVYVVFEKIEYTVVLTGYNSIDLRGVYAIDNIVIDISGEQEIFTNDDTSRTDYTLTNTIKITQSLALTAKLNTGLLVEFNLKQDKSMPIEVLELNEEVIELIENNILYIYVIETFKTYTLEYITQVKIDENLGQSVIMADLSAEAVDVLNAKHQISSVEEILDDNNNVIANKVTISGLYYGDKVKLNSAGKTQTVGEDSYTYIFHKFYKGQVTNTLTKGEDNYTHTQADLNEAIYVVYGLPIVTLEISWTNLTQEDFSYTVSDNAEETGNPNEFKSGVGERVTITVFDVKFGYSLTKYNYNQANKDEDVNGSSVTIVIGPNVNVLKLIFTVDSYRFAFQQWREGFNGEKYAFNGINSKDLMVNDRMVAIDLPTGMYVEKASVEGRELKDVFGEDAFTQDNSTTDLIYNFELSVAQLEELVKNYTSHDANGDIIIINLTYKKHEYSLTFRLVISGGLDEFNSTIAAPTLTVVDGDNKPLESNNNNGNHVQEFFGIKHGTSISLLVGDDLKQGLRFTTWNLTGNINQTNSNELAIEAMSSNVVAEYVVVYVHYAITLYNHTGNGLPVVSVNDVESSTIKLFDSLNINPNAYPGIRIKSISNIKVYTYNAATWLTDYTSLFFRENGKVVPANETYDASKLYFYAEEVLATNSEAGNMIYKDEQFIADEYYISTITSGQQTLQCVCIDLQYEYIPYTVTHTVTGLDGRWLAMFGETPIYALEDNGEALDLVQTYTKNDSLNYVFKISTQAAIGDLTYNLTGNVLLSSLKINDTLITLPANEGGRYTITFNVGNHLPKDNGEVIRVEYELKITQKTVTVKTQIEEDQTGSFKDNLEFQIGKENDAPQPIYGELSTKETFDYLTNIVKISAQFTSRDLAEAFEFGEVQIYLGDNKTPLNASECEALGVTIERNKSKAVTNVKYRLDNDIVCVFIVRPKIEGFQSGTKFSKEFKCDSFGAGVAQPLIVGTDKEINISNSFQVEVVYYNSHGNQVENPTNAGIYDVIISFNGEGWMSQIGQIGSAILEITPKVITAMYDTSAPKQTKFYNGSSDYYLSANEINNILFDFRSFTDSQPAKVAYSVVKGWANNKILLNDSKISAFSTTGGEVGKVQDANESTHYNLYVQGLSINSANFSLSSSTFEIANYLQIQRKQIKLVNVNVQNKVFDNTTVAKVQQQNGKAIDVVGEIMGEELMINASLLTINFEDKEIGLNKKVTVKNIRNALTEINCNANNYTIENEMEVETKAGIYPDRITKKVEGLGEISIINLRGLNSEDNDLITLIPINSRIEVKIIYQDSPEYRNVYRVFGKNVRGNNEFAIGYSLKLISNETVQDISKDLYVQVPNIKHLTGAYYLTGQSTGKISYALTGEGVLIDLQGLSVDLDKLMFTQQRILLKVWQIVLIVILFILLIVVIILLIIIIRRKKKKDYSVHEKI